VVQIIATTHKKTKKITTIFIHKAKPLAAKTDDKLQVDLSITIPKLVSIITN